MSRSAVSRPFVERTRRSLGEMISRRLDDVGLAHKLDYKNLSRPR
jgi:uncharacterized protein YjiS (DUF1127 family)